MSSLTHEGPAVPQWAKTFLWVMAIGLLLVSPDTAHAQEAWTGVIEEISDILTGGVARALAILVCIGLGLLAYFSILSIRQFGFLAIGIVLVFGSASLVDLLISAAGG